MQGIERKIEKQDNGSGQVQCVANRPKKSVWGCQCLAWFFVQRPSICRRPRDISISEK